MYFMSTLKSVLQKKKITSVLGITCLAVSSILLSVSCQSKQFDANLSTGQLGLYDNIPVNMSELTPAEMTQLNEAQKKLYDVAQNILIERFLNAWFIDYQNKNKLPSVEAAKLDFFSKNAQVSDVEINAFLSQNAANPQLQQIPQNERFTAVKQYLQRMAQNKAEQSIIEPAISGEKIKVTKFALPKEAAITFSEGGNVFFVNYDPLKLQQNSE